LLQLRVAHAHSGLRELSPWRAPIDLEITT
jgi:hypothetical protein